MKPLVTALSIALAFSFMACGGSESAKQPDEENPGKTDPEQPDNPNYDYPDEDGDTIGDEREDKDKGIDTDNDTTPDYKDLDSDNDGIPDAIEGGTNKDTHMIAVDSDGDGTPDFRDLDSDDNFIPDTAEAGPDPLHPVDTDANGTYDFADPDNDSDGILDIDEITGLIAQSANGPLRDENGKFIAAFDCNNDTIRDSFGSTSNPIDCDSDTVPDYLDSDSDADTIKDFYEGTRDSNADGFADRYVQDSDADTVPDSVEAGATQPPLNSDDDSTPDFQDYDSDNDGLSDNLEPHCNDRDARIHFDTDNDGFSDLAEYVTAKEAGKDPNAYICDPALKVSEFYEFYFELPANGSEKSDTLTFTPRVQKADIFFSIDITGSMQTALDAVKTALSGTLPQSIKERVTQSAFGVAFFTDFDVSPVWILASGINETLKTVTDAISTQKVILGTTDESEIAIESLYQIATGSGVPGKINSTPVSPERRGGGQFRQASLPIIISISDAASHDPGSASGAHNSTQTYAALNQLGARVITMQTELLTDQGPMKQARSISNATRASVPVCAFKDNSNKWICGSELCCTSIMSSHRIEPVDGKCVLSYLAPTNHAKFVQSVNDIVVQGVEALAKYATYDISTRTTGTALPDDKTTACFIQRVEALSYTPPSMEPEKSCAPTASAKDFSGRGYNDGFTNFATGIASDERPSSKLTFKVVAQNADCVQPSTEAKIYKTSIDVVDPITGIVFDTQNVAIIVPGQMPQAVN